MTDTVVPFDQSARSMLDRVTCRPIHPPHVRKEP